MLSLTPERLMATPFPTSTAWLLAACMEAKGRQDSWTHQKPETLEALREQAVIQSAESSNRIEGVTIAPERLRPVVLGGSRPRDRSEEEIAGYRKALNWIFTRKRRVTMDVRVILHLHSLAQGGASGDAGQWKARNNEIIEMLPNGERRVRFRPASAKETPALMQALCDNYESMSDAGQVPALQVAATFVLDFLCIHPFRDGNGRVSRLLTLLILKQHGFEAGRYISLERLIEESRADYYRVLAECSRGWHESENELTSWWNYFLSVVSSAYRELAERIKRSSCAPAKSDLVRQVVESQIGEFTLAELRAQLHSVSAQLIKKVLSEMKEQDLVRLTGRGRGARWRIVADARGRE
jgi:Fic family protein